MHVAEVAEQVALHAPVADLARQGHRPLVVLQRLGHASFVELQVAQSVVRHAFQPQVAGLARHPHRRRRSGRGPLRACPRRRSRVPEPDRHPDLAHAGRPRHARRRVPGRTAHAAGPWTPAGLPARPPAPAARVPRRGRSAPASRTPTRPARRRPRTAPAGAAPPMRPRARRRPRRRRRARSARRQAATRLSRSAQSSSSARAPGPSAANHATCRICAAAIAGGPLPGVAPRGLQVLGGVDLHADEQVEAAIAAQAHERLVDERVDHVHDPRRVVDAGEVEHRLGRLEREAALEDRQLGQRRLLGRRQQVPRPVECRAQGRLAVEALAPGREQLEALAHAPQQHARRHHAHPRRGQLDRQRQAVEQGHQRRDRRVGLRRSGRKSGLAASARCTNSVPRVGRRQRRQRQHLFAGAAPAPRAS